MMILPEQYFYLHEGTSLRDLYDLAQALKVISDEVYNYHVNSEKNDFANWTKEVLKDNVLSARMIKCKNKESMLKIVENRIAYLNKVKTKKVVISKIKEAVNE